LKFTWFQTKDYGSEKFLKLTSLVKKIKLKTQFTKEYNWENQKYYLTDPLKVNWS